MVTREENELMTRIGPGTPAGELLRRYWHPVCPVAELTAQKPKKRMRILGEDLVLFRDGSGRLGLVAEQCPHRRASLYYGFIEEDGLRCAYHGWKFDTAGICLEQPFEAAGAKKNVCHTAYPVEQLAGILWTYLGPKPAPLLPQWEVLVGHRGPRKVIAMPDVDCNWLQIMENSVDTTHTHYLHAHMMIKMGMPERGAYYARPIEAYDFETVTEDTWAGIRKIREWGGERREKELGHPVIFPCSLLVPASEHVVMHFRVPIDDTHTRIIRVQYTPGADTTGMDWDHPPVEYSAPYKDAGGEYDLRSFPAQDAMAWETEGPIMDRTKERLGASDRGIALYRRMLKDQIAAVQAGMEPIGLIRDPAKNREIMIDVSEGQARMARERTRAAG